MTVEQINNEAAKLQTDPRLLLSDMSMSEFRQWLKINSTQLSQEVVFDNLADVLLEYEMYSFYYIVLDELDKL